MVTLDEMKAKRKIKVLLKGFTDTGKSFTCVKIADVVLKAGKRVLYLDHEAGSVEEIVEYIEENGTVGESGKKEIKNLIYEPYYSYIDLLEKMKKNIKDGIDLIIIDPMPLLQICRISATDEIKKQGFYYMGEKMVTLVDITEPDKYAQRIADGALDNRITYALRGWQYQLANDWEMGFKDFLVSMPSDIVATLLMPDAKNSLDPCFDYVVDMTKIESSKQVQKAGGIAENVIEKTYRGIPRKVRGAKVTQVVELVNPWKSVIKPFERKYLGKESD